MSKKIILLIVLLISIPQLALAGEVFYVDSDYDLYSRDQITATLKGVFAHVYFYIENDWWDSLGIGEHNAINSSFQNLGNEFDSDIYPELTSVFGTEWKPGIDRDEKITVLIHPMEKRAGGYFNPADEYFRFQVPGSNEREMLYLNSEHITGEIAKSYLAHEFTHLITFNQKDKIYGVSEEIWLNESRAEYASTLVGYDEDFKESNLENRVQQFLKNPSDSLLEWQNKNTDYGVINLFCQYLVDHYGIEILADSLQSDKVGIPSLNYALSKNGFSEDFSQVFTDWTVTVLVNDCSLGEKYCYLNPNLETFRITPQINFLPLTGESILAVTNMTSDWAGNWQKFVGGKGTLTLEFDGDDRVNFTVPYVVCEKEGSCSVDFLTLDDAQEGKVVLSEFDKEYTSLTIIPSIQSKISDFDGKETSYYFSFRVSTSEKNEEEEKLIEELLAQIGYLQKEIAKVQAEIAAIIAKRGQKISCQKIEMNLYYGLRNDSQVRCLQEFLKAQGLDIYPEGLVTGYFGPLTQTAVIRFQENHRAEILEPLGLTNGTGFVGPSTRTFINQY